MPRKSKTEPAQLVAPAPDAGQTTGFFDATLRVSDDDVRSWLVGAFEGGSNYWIDRVDIRLREGLTSRSPELNIHNDGGGAPWQKIYAAPFVRGCYLEFIANDEAINGSTGPFKLDREAIARGLQCMLSGCTPDELKQAGNDYKRRHLGDLLAGNDDADTADVFLQCCLFGEAVFG